VNVDNMEIYKKAMHTICLLLYTFGSADISSPLTIRTKRT
jgi:hypothetical protein